MLPAGDSWMEWTLRLVVGVDGPRRHRVCQTEVVVVDLRQRRTVTARHARRQPNPCCEQTCQRRATSDTRAPGAKVSSTIRAFSSADQRRRRTGPVRTSTRRNSPFASSLTSNIAIARSPLCLGATQPPSGRSSKKGVRAPLTLYLSPHRHRERPAGYKCLPALAC
jgi:hypothetical protein